MKKRIFILLMISVIVIYTPVYALQFSYQTLNSDAVPPLQQIDGAYILGMNNQDYLLCNYSQYTLPMKNDPGLYNALKTNMINYIWTGDCYMVRNTSMDGIWLGQYYSIKPLQFYDKNYNLISEHNFDQHIMAMGFYDGTYYCQLMRSDKNPDRIMKSTDKINWTETDEKIPYQISNITFTENQVAFPDTNLFQISYEDKKDKKMYSTLGEWIVKKGEDNNYYLSNDNVYFVKVEYPQELGTLDNQYGFDYKFRSIYESGDNICIDLKRATDFRVENMASEEELNEFKQTWLNKVVRLTVPKQPIYDELERQKNAPYVKVADEILGFETAPIMEEDRTLVPMRFLFEKLGAEVTWDQATMTATAQKENTTINFSINQTNAVVNGTNEQMDVPARLVNDKTMVPLRFLSEELGYEVDWNQELRMATIDTNTGDTETANETGIELFFKNIGQTIAGWFNE